MWEDYLALPREENLSSSLTNKNKREEIPEFKEGKESNNVPNGDIVTRWILLRKEDFNEKKTASLSNALKRREQKHMAKWICEGGYERGTS